ncbi:MAG: hypothetical protein ACE5FP_06350 [Gemmatimonadota bacterium]
MNDQDGTIEERIAESARELYHVPPPTPGEEIWAGIRTRLDGEATPVVPIQPREERISGLAWWIGVAAALAIGLALGRMSIAPVPSGDAAVEIAEGAEGGSPEAARRLLPYVVATNEHLDRAESLLMTVKADRGDSSPDLDVGAWARSLLARTRLLMETPAAATPEMRTLLEDLELTLMQVVVTAESDDPQEARILDRDLTEGDLMLRLRSTNWTRIGPARGL